MSNNESTMKDTTFYTNNRLTDYLKNYTEYVTTVLGSSQDELYKYYHFDHSPDGIKKKNLGRIPSGLLTGVNPASSGMIDPTYPNVSNPKSYPAPISAWDFNNTTQTANNITQSVNTPDGWFMELSKSYSKIKTAELDNYKKYEISAGLTYKLTTDISYIQQKPQQNLNPYQVNKSAMQYFITQFTRIPNSSSVSCGKSMMDSFDRALNIPELSSKYSNPLGIEWFGYFKPPALGVYTLTLNVGQGFAAIWVDDDALYDYTYKNGYFTSPSILPLNIQITEPKYYPIRIQYYANSIESLTSGQRVFDLKIVNTKTSKPLNNSEVFFTINKNTYYPPLLYCAFVSSNLQTFSLGEFQCYVCNTQKDTSHQFTDIILKYKFDIENNVFDVDRGTPNQTNFGILPNGITYTEVFDAKSKYPSTFSVYRIDVDPRMGNTYQINTQKTGIYPMNPIATDILTPANTYEEIDNYYVDTATSFQASPEACKTQCNKNSETCNYYFTYTANGSDRCVIDTTSTKTMKSIPNFSQIRPASGSNINLNVDVGSSNLYMRNNELHPPPCDITGPISVQPVINTSNYTKAFPYALYDLDPTPIKDLSFVGVCGDASYLTISQGAYNILFDNTAYQKDGQWKNSSGAWTNTEGFDETPIPTKYTNALSDTRDVVNAELQNSKIYAEKQQKINDNYGLLGKKNIPQYLGMRDMMNANDRYDYNGNILLYYKNQPIPNLQEQNIIDSKQGFHMQNSLYVLGSLTAATLLILAIILGRD